MESSIEKIGENILEATAVANFKLLPAICPER